MKTYFKDIKECGINECRIKQCQINECKFVPNLHSVILHIPNFWVIYILRFRILEVYLQHLVEQLCWQAGRSFLCKYKMVIFKPVTCVKCEGEGKHILITNAVSFNSWDFRYTIHVCIRTLHKIKQWIKLYFFLIFSL